MKRLTISISTILIAMVAAGAGCGGKNKKAESTAVTPDTSRSPDRKADPSTDRDGTELDDAERARLAELSGVIYFEFDSTTLSPESRDALEKNAAWLQEDAQRRLTIEGHTDEVGTDEYNLALGARRARAAYDYLVRLGVPAERIDVITFGEERPAGAEDPENRRAMFVATAPQT